MTSRWLQDDFKLTQRTQRALSKPSKSTQRGREHSDCIIPSEPKILCLVHIWTWDPELDTPHYSGCKTVCSLWSCWFYCHKEFGPETLSLTLLTIVFRLWHRRFFFIIIIVILLWRVWTWDPELDTLLTLTCVPWPRPRAPHTPRCTAPGHKCCHPASACS